MSTSTDGILAFGVNLGDDGDDWDGLTERGVLPSWDDDGDGDGDVAEGVDPETLILNRLLEVAGFTEPNPDPLNTARRGEPLFEAWQDWYHRHSAAIDALPVELVTHCSDNSPMLILAARSVTVASRGYPKAVDLTVDTTAMRAAVDAALAALGMVPKVGPGWLLASYWG